MRLKDRIFSISVRCSLMEKESLFLLNLVSFPVAILYWFKYGKKGSGESARA